MQVDDKLAKEKLISEIYELASRSTISGNDNPAAIATIVQQDIKRHIIELIRNTDLTDCQPPMEDCSVTQAEVPPSVGSSGTQRLLDRCRDALKRIHDGHAPMRIPADMTDADIVLADCIEEIIRLDRVLSYERIDVPHIERQLWKEAVVREKVLAEGLTAIEAIVRTTIGNARGSACDAGSGIKKGVVAPDQGSVRNATDRGTEKLRAWDDGVALMGPNAPMWDGHIEHLIRYLLTVHKRFGNTAVTADIELQWGATALHKRDAQKYEIARLEALLEDAIRALPDQKD